VVDKFASATQSHVEIRGRSSGGGETNVPSRPLGASIGLVAAISLPRPLNCNIELYLLATSSGGIPLLHLLVMFRALPLHRQRHKCWRSVFSDEGVPCRHEVHQDVRGQTQQWPASPPLLWVSIRRGVDIGSGRNCY
jgi:hypothetical protein